MKTPEYQKHFMKRNNVLQALESRMEKKLQAYRPDPKDFEDIYGKESVQKDIDFVNMVEKGIREEDSHKTETARLKKERIDSTATITEGILIDQMSGDWLNLSDSKNRPYDVIAHPTSKYDDYKRGADLALEIINRKQETEKHLGLSVDITYSSNSSVVASKVEQILKELQPEHIQKYGTPKIKYFENDAETYKGSVDIARCVLVVDSGRLPDLFEKEIKRDRDALAKDPIQASLLMQMELQSRMFKEFAQNCGNAKAVEIYEETLNNIRLLKLQKEKETNSNSFDLSRMRVAHKDLNLLMLVIKNSLRELEEKKLESIS